ncbi:GHMP kinase [Pleurocapsales cyanobacterium LEGE 06147]|nr:GHMP kinase [Pleurocapsales cyanobacterium LEGE 06147]
MKLFVPGRLCLFGEHSDWAGEYRRLNSNLEKGYALIVGTNQGIYAESESLGDDRFVVVSDCRKLSLPLNREALRAEAERGGFFSYAAGVAYQILTRYSVGGVAINNYLTDLPIQKGLSSSAAICVLVARAFNHLYQLNLSLQEEMELAYLGERTTPSRCGRMDQACAYGNQPILIVFDGDRLEITPLTVPKNLFLVIVNLGATKDTRSILQQLNRCYPFATDEIQQQVQKYLGKISSQITQQAVSALQQGDAAKIGFLMKRAQAEFDRYLIPACPTQLTAPVLHQLLNHKPIQPYILGGKGVGSQGDGTAQLIVQDETNQQKVIKIIQRDFPQMQCFQLTIAKTSS